MNIKHWNTPIGINTWVAVDRIALQGDVLELTVSTSGLNYKMTANGIVAINVLDEFLPATWMSDEDSSPAERQLMSEIGESPWILNLKDQGDPSDALRHARHFVIRGADWLVEFLSTDTPEWKVDD